MKTASDRIATGLQDALAPAAQRYVPLDPEVDLTGNRILVDADADEAGVEAARRAFRRARFREHEPWLTGRIPSDASRQGALPYVLVGLGVALIAAGIGAGLTWGGGLWLVGGFLTLIGAGFAGISLQILRQQRRYPFGELRLDATPLLLGESFRGAVRTGIHRSTSPAEGFRLGLRCVLRRRTGSGSSAHTSERTLWEHEESATGTPDPEGDRLRLEVAAVLPADQPPTTLGPGPERYLWRLSVRAEMPGLDYHESFELPVFRPHDAEALTR